MTVENLGITPEYQEILKNVSVICHCAATVRFDEPLQKAITLNVGGTYRALEFAQSLKKLKVFMHVSTFYTNPKEEFLEEKVYTPPMDWKFCLDKLQNFEDDDVLRSLSHKWVNYKLFLYKYTINLIFSELLKNFQIPTILPKIFQNLWSTILEIVYRL